MIHYTKSTLYGRNQFPLFYGKIVFQLESQLSLSWVELRRWWSNRMFQVYYHEITADWSRHKLVATLLMTSLRPSDRQGTNWVKIKCQFSVCLLCNWFKLGIRNCVILYKDSLKIGYILNRVHYVNLVWFVQCYKGKNSCLHKIWKGRSVVIELFPIFWIWIS